MERLFGDDFLESPREQWVFLHHLDTVNITQNRIAEIQRLVPVEGEIPSRAGDHPPARAL